MRALTRMLLLLSLLFLPSYVKAAPIVITDGEVILRTINGEPLYAISGQDFSLNASGSGGNGLPCPLCTPSDQAATFSLSKTLSGDQISSGSATFNGVQYPRLLFEGLFEFTAGTVKIPTIVAPEIVLSTPFTFSGKLCARTQLSPQGDGCRPDHPDFAFSTELAGQGVATIRLVLDGFAQTGAPIYRATTLTYTFSPNPQQTITFTDDFNDNSRDDGKWSLGVIDGSRTRFDPLVAVEEKNQRLEITPTSSMSDYRYGGYLSSSLWNLTGGSAMVEVLQTATSGADTIFAIGIDHNNWYRFIVEDGRLYFQRMVAGVKINEPSVPYDRVQHRFWRFRHDYLNNQVVLEAGPDGVNWSTIRPMPRFMSLEPLRVELSAGTFTSNSNPGKAIFDNFKLETLNQAPITSTTVGLADFDSSEAAGPVYDAFESDALGPEGVITVKRIGDDSTAFTVDYATVDPNASLVPCQNSRFTRKASERCDYATTAGTLRFARGETTKTIRIPIINDAYLEGLEYFTIVLRNPQGANLNVASTAQIVIVDDEENPNLPPPATPNPIDRQNFFIRQQYIDFLGRLPEPAGFQFWMNRMSNCPSGQVCDRIDTSMRFFQSDEFQSTGFFVYRMYDAVLGRRPTYKEFMQDVGSLTGLPTVEQQQLARRTYVFNFILRSEFRSIYGAYMYGDNVWPTEAERFVDALIEMASVTLTPSTRQALIDNLRIEFSPRQTLEDFINAPEVSGVGTRIYDRGFITMQYFGYLRRDAEQAGFNFWVGQLIGPNAPHRGDYRFMVEGFLNSDEYRYRFAAPTQ